MVDEVLLERSIEMYLEDLEGKNWPNLTKGEIELIRDEQKRKEYLKKYRECMNVVILPLLYNMDNRNNFKFSNPDNLLTCNNMMKDIYAYYKKRGFNKEELCVIATEKKTGKGY